ncbi:MAG: hypothetical protein AAF431_19135 [Pseudomonadota bacterium]
MTAIAEQEGSVNINGPAVIKVPDWIENPLGEYYLYFAHHKGDYIRLAYADQPAGPWQIYEPGVLSLVDSGFPTQDLPQLSAAAGLAELWQNLPVRLFRDTIRVIYKTAVTDQKVRAERGIALSKTRTPHIASPEVVVDHDQQRLVLFYHGQRDSLAQVSRIAVSTDGLVFTTQGDSFPAAYVKSFQLNGKYYLLGALGMLMRSDSLVGPYEIRSRPLFGPEMRHPAVWLDAENSLLRVFWSKIGAAPEHILVSEVDVSPGWQQWQATKGRSVLKPELSWEGADLPNMASLRGEISMPARELRDPYFFRDTNGSQYLFYTGAVEQVIGLVGVESPN